MPIVDTRARPHHLDPARHTVRVIHAVKNFAAIQGVCHIGLGVTATNCVKVLRKAGYFAEAWATQTAFELEQHLAKDEQHILKHGGVPPSHVIISAPSWVQPEDFARMAIRWPEIIFVQLNHSGCAFLSIDKFGIKNIREVSHLEMSLPNVMVAGNNMRFVTWVNRTIGKCLHLPNLYDTSSFVHPYPTKRDYGHTIRIGSFGASRPWKNQLTAAEGMLELAKTLGVNLELYVNSKRPDGGERMIESRAELFDGFPGAKLIEVPWLLWPKFRKVVSHMHLLVQPSFDETFNVVTADGIAEGVASVTSESIEWTPKSWWAETANPSDLARTGMYLLNDPYAVEDGRRSLTKYAQDGLNNWKDFLGR